MKRIFFDLLLLFVSYFVDAQTFIQAYQDRANQVTQTNINTYLNEFVSYGVKTTGSTNNVNAFNWLKTKYQSFGYTTSQIVEDPFTYGANGSKNLVVTKTGTLYPNTFVIVCGHFDTINGVGAGDNGSGTAVMLETARILKDIPTEYSVKFIHFSGEEQGLLGSQHYVNNVVNATTPKMDIKVVFNLDQVGGISGQTHNTIYCDIDQSAPNFNNAASQAMAQQLATCTTLYSPLQTQYYLAYASDYIPFENNGEVITGFYEYQGQNNPNTHSSTDTINNLDPVYVMNVAKAAVGATQHFAIATSQNMSVENIENKNDQFQIIPNPAKDFIELNLLNGKTKNFQFEIFDASGRLIMSVENETKINISDLENGVYTGTLLQNGDKLSKKILVKK